MLLNRRRTHLPHIMQRSLPSRSFWVGAAMFVRPARLGIALSLALIWTLFSICGAAVSPAQAARLHQTVTTQEILVHFDPETTPEARDALIAEMGGELVTWIHQLHVAEIRVPVVVDAAGSSPSYAQALGVAATSGMVTHVEADMTVAAAFVPSDPDFSDATMSYGLEQIQAIDAWDVVTGSHDIVIAVIDSGIQADHPEFVGRLVPGYNFIDENRPDDLSDASGHGTHVAGILAAALNNGQGIAGVCPNCRIMPIKVLNGNNVGSWSQLAQGITYAVDNGAQILNLSLGTAVPSGTLAFAVEYAIERGVVVVAAAGNFASDAPFYPAAYEGVIGVGATTKAGTRWAKSDFGAYIDLVAPGELIYSTYHDLNNIYQGYTYMNGTSMAAPYVSGVAGLLLSVAPNLRAEDVVAAMLMGTDDLGESGRDDDFGYGRVNAMGALRAPIAGLVEAVGEFADPHQQVVMYLPALNRE